MKSILVFVRTTLTGGILFLIPVILVIVILEKANLVIEKLSAPLADYLPDRIFGFDGSALLALLLLLLLCFISGLLFRSAAIKKGITNLEDNLLSYLPGYTLIKSIAADAIGEKIDRLMHPVLVGDEAAWNIGYLVEENEKFCTVFLPDAPRLDAGEVKIVPASAVKKLNITSDKAARSLKMYGKGAINWIQ